MGVFPTMEGATKYFASLAKRYPDESFSIQTWQGRKKLETHNLSNEPT